MNFLRIAFIIYLLLINVIAVIITVYDKLAAKNHKWRIKESTLLLLSALGSSAVMYITMLIIRHKTLHIKFMLGIPLIFVAQCFVFYFIIGALYG